MQPWSVLYSYLTCYLLSLIVPVYAHRASCISSSRQYWTRSLPVYRTDLFHLMGVRSKPGHQREQYGCWLQHTDSLLGQQWRQGTYAASVLSLTHTLLCRIARMFQDYDVHVFHELKKLVHESFNPRNWNVYKLWHLISPSARIVKRF